MFTAIVHELFKSIVVKIISIIGFASTVATVFFWFAGSGQSAAVLAAISGWALFLATLWALIGKIRGEQQAGTALEQPGSHLWLLDRATNVVERMIGQRTVNDQGVPVWSRVQWPDGTHGEFRATQIDPSGAIDSYEVTYEPLGGQKKTVHQAAPQRDSVGNVVNQPEMTVT